MFPVNDLNGINKQEILLEGNHAVILLFVKPSDKNADEIIDIYLGIPIVKPEQISELNFECIIPSVW